MDDLRVNDRFKHYERLLGCIKRWLIDRSKEPETKGLDLYKFVGDGWILLLPGDLDGGILLQFMRGLCEMVKAELDRHIVPYLGSVLPVMGVTVGLDKGYLDPMKMNNRPEYVGRALNVACRLLNALKVEASPQYKALMPAYLFNENLKTAAMPFKCDPLALPLPKMLGEDGFACRRIELAVSAEGVPIPWSTENHSAWSCAQSNWP
jgi:hypothetical protein